MKILQPIVKNMEKLNALVEEYPVSIPLAEMLKLMGMNSDSLCAAIDCSSFKLGYS